MTSYPSDQASSLRTPLREIGPNKPGGRREEGSGDKSPALSARVRPTSAIALFLLLCGVLRIADPIRWAGIDGITLAYIGIPCVLLVVPLGRRSVRRRQSRFASEITKD